jgi:hypothetical protein
VRPLRSPRAPRAGAWSAVNSATASSPGRAFFCRPSVCREECARLARGGRRPRCELQRQVARLSQRYSAGVGVAGVVSHGNPVRDSRQRRDFPNHPKRRSARVPDRRCSWSSEAQVPGTCLPRSLVALKQQRARAPPGAMSPARPGCRRPPLGRKATAPSGEDAVCGARWAYAGVVAGSGRPSAYSVLISKYVLSLASPSVESM